MAASKAAIHRRFDIHTNKDFRSFQKLLKKHSLLATPPLEWNPE